MSKIEITLLMKRVLLYEIFEIIILELTILY